MKKGHPNGRPVYSISARYRFRKNLSLCESLALPLVCSEYESAHKRYQSSASEDAARQQFVVIDQNSTNAYSEKCDEKTADHPELSSLDFGIHGTGLETLSVVPLLLSHLHDAVG